jgi:hypothetical protein
MVAFVRGRIWFLIGLGILAAGQPSRADQDPNAGIKPPTPVAATSDQVLVLQNGNVLQGVVTLRDDRYVIARGTGETLVPTNHVMLVAASLDDAYAQRRRRINESSADDHSALAEWCLKQDLLPQAEQELADARRLHLSGVRLEFLERRLELAKERRQRAAVAIPRPQTNVPKIIPPAGQAPMDLTELPPGVVERFTRKVQPVLVNSCTASGCHAVGGTAKFQLDRAVLLGMSNRRTTMNNLAATLSLVDREKPQHSALLTVPRQTHGGMKGPVFGPRREAAFRHLFEWVELVTANTATPADVPRADGAGLAAGAQQESSVVNVAADRGGKQDDQTIPASYEDQAIPAAVDNAAFTDGTDGIRAKSPLRYGVQLQSWRPRDDFDPEIFNRKYSPRSSAAVETASSDSLSQPEPAERIPRREKKR